MKTTQDFSLIQCSAKRKSSFSRSKSQKHLTGSIGFFDYRQAEGLMEFGGPKVDSERPVILFQADYSHLTMSLWFLPKDIVFKSRAARGLWSSRVL